MPDQNVVVTGAAGILGSAVVDRLAVLGWNVIAIDYAQIPETPPLKLALSGIDLADGIAVKRAFATIGQEHERLAALVNIAGAFRWQTVDDGDVETWDLLYRINVRTAFLASRAALPFLRQNGGAIVNVGALAAQKSGAGMGAYAASKSGVARLTESLAEEMKDHRVRVNAVLPSIIDTPANRADMPEADFSRWVGPDALADVIAFLVSDAARAVSGALIPVAGRV